MELSPQQERNLVEQAVSGSADAFGELYSTHLDSIYRYIYFRVGERLEAEDLTEMVFLKAWEALPGYLDKGFPFTSWLYRIAHNIVVDHHRRRQRVDPPDDRIQIENRAEEGVSTLGKIIENEERTELAMAISRLPDEQQQVIILRFIEGLSHTQVANIIGKNEGTCRMIQHRALTALNKVLSRE